MQSKDGAWGSVHSYGTTHLKLKDDNGEEEAGADTDEEAFSETVASDLHIAVKVDGLEVQSSPKDLHAQEGRLRKMMMTK